MGVRVDFTPGGRPVKHGGAGTAYAHYGCRCVECCEANTRRTKRRRIERNPAEATEHGTTSTYNNWNCRCAPCSKAKEEANARQYKNRRARGLS